MDRRRRAWVHDGEAAQMNGAGEYVKRQNAAGRPPQARRAALDIPPRNMLTTGGGPIPRGALLLPCGEQSLQGDALGGARFPKGAPRETRRSDVPRRRSKTEHSQAGPAEGSPRAAAARPPPIGEQREEGRRAGCGLRLLSLAAAAAAEPPAPAAAAAAEPPAPSRRRTQDRGSGPKRRGASQTRQGGDGSRAEKARTSRDPESPADGTGGREGGPPGEPPDKHTPPGGPPGSPLWRTGGRAPLDRRDDNGPLPKDAQGRRLAFPRTLEGCPINGTGPGISRRPPGYVKRPS